ncbi:unnamed protein product [Rotaria sp. Silwood1]|nr:unnamed protein product [Rotaria sp. Silwood1]CAF1413306.1 unnamed protein product [Rotaria sp. Silwood1]CAF3648685.1 unnamed protein product [Rotaria sp. Silwood1]
MTIENLLKAAEEVQLTDEKDTGMRHSYGRTFDDRNASSVLIEEDVNFLTPTTSVTQKNLRNTLTKKVDDAAHLIKDKNIILFFGEAGTGKSTIIHFLGGCQMKYVKVNGLNHITPISIKNPHLKTIKTSPFAQSETLYFTPVTVNIRDVGGDTDGAITLCDTLGFANTIGAEVDIANAIGIARAVKECKSVKPVVLISYKSIGNQFRDVKELASVIVRLIPEIKDNIKAFSFIFTKFPDEEKGTIHPLLRDIYDELREEEKSNVSFMTFLKDMLQKTRRSVRVLDPINNQPGEILDELAESASIFYPDEVFQFYIIERSKTIVQEQVRKHQLSIMSATKRSEYSFVQYKLAQLKQLNNLLGQDYIGQIYDECVRYISRHLSEEYQSGISILNRCLNNQTVLSIDDIEQYRTCINHDKLADKLRNDYLRKEVVHSSALIVYLDQQVDIIIKSLLEKDIDDLSVKISLDKIKVLTMYFSDINVKYKDACQRFSEKDITKLYDACIVLEQHLNREYMTTIYCELKRYFLEVFTDSVSKLNYILSQEKYGNETIESLKECIRMFETAISTLTLQSHISKEDINQIYEDFLIKIMNHYEWINEKIMTELRGQCSFREIEQLFKEITSIRTISVIESRTNQSYYSILEQICGCIRELRKEIEEVLNGFYRNEKNNYSGLMKSLSTLKHAKWIEEYRLEVYADVINNIKEQILKHVKDLEKTVLQTVSNLDNYDQIERFFAIQASTHSESSK